MLDRGGSGPSHAALLPREEDCELYVRLLCEFQPQAVLPFLQSVDTYRRVEALLWTCTTLSTQ